MLADVKRDTGLDSNRILRSTYIERYRYIFVLGDPIRDTKNSYVYSLESVRNGVQNGSGAHPASYPMGTRCSFVGGKAAGA
jgi:hypothetical protein